MGVSVGPLHGPSASLHFTAVGAAAAAAAAPLPPQPPTHKQDGGKRNAQGCWVLADARADLGALGEVLLGAGVRRERDRVLAQCLQCTARHAVSTRSASQRSPCGQRVVSALSARCQHVFTRGRNTLQFAQCLQGHGIRNDGSGAIAAVWRSRKLALIESGLITRTSAQLHTGTCTCYAS